MPCMKNISQPIFNFLRVYAAPSSMESSSNDMSWSRKKIPLTVPNGFLITDSYLFNDFLNDRWQNYATPKLVCRMKEWMNECRNQMVFVALKEGGDREKLEVHWEKLAPDQVRLTDSQVKLTLFVKQAWVTPLSLVGITSLSETDNPKFSWSQDSQTLSFWICFLKRTPGGTKILTMLKKRVKNIKTTHLRVTNNTLHFLNLKGSLNHLHCII